MVFKFSAPNVEVLKFFVTDMLFLLNALRNYQNLEIKISEIIFIIV